MLEIKLHGVSIGGRVYPSKRNSDHYIYYEVMVSTGNLSNEKFAETYAWAIHKSEIYKERKCCEIHPKRPAGYNSRQKILLEKDMSSILKVNHCLDYYPQVDKDFRILMVKEISKEEAIKINQIKLC